MMSASITPQHKRSPKSRLGASSSQAPLSPSAVNANVAFLIAPVVIVSFLIHRFCFKPSGAAGRGVQVVGTAKPRRDRKVTLRSPQQQQQRNGAAAAPVSGQLGKSIAGQGQGQQEQAFLQVLQQMKLHAMQSQHDGGPSMLMPLDDADGEGQDLLDDWADSWAPDLDHDYNLNAEDDEDEDGGYFYDEDEEQEGEAAMDMDFMDALGDELGRQIGRDMGGYLEQLREDGEEDGLFNEEELDEMMEGMAADNFMFDEDDGYGDDYGDFLDEYETEDDEEDLDSGARVLHPVPGAPGASSGGSGDAAAASPVGNVAAKQ